jgi:hypothetical protein
MWAARPGVGLTKAARGDDTVIREQFNLVVEQDDTPLHSRLQPCPGLIRHDPCCEVIQCRPLRAPRVDSGPCFLRSREQVSDCAATDAALRIDKTCRFTRAAHLQIRYLYEHTGIRHSRPAPRTRRIASGRIPARAERQNPAVLAVQRRARWLRDHVADSAGTAGAEYRRGHRQASGPFAEPIEPALRDTVHSLRQPSGNQIAPLPRQQVRTLRLMVG